MGGSSPLSMGVGLFLRAVGGAPRSLVQSPVLLGLSGLEPPSIGGRGGLSGPLDNCPQSPFRTSYNVRAWLVEMD
jgi:hypothetical protein